MMSFSLDVDQNKRGLGSLDQHDVIEFESQFVDLDIYMVTAIEKNDEIPAILLQLWKFDGGYNHEFKNVMENDLGINTQVPYFKPNIRKAIVEKIKLYRPAESGLSKKEELFFDVWPEITNEQQTDTCDTPYEVQIRYEDGTTDTLIIPSWTPLQRLPLDRIQCGTEVETWSIKDITNIMKVTQL